MRASGGCSTPARRRARTAAAAADRPRDLRRPPRLARVCRGTRCSTSIRRLYEEYDPAAWHDRSLRDPWVAPDPAARGFRMWFTARAKDGPPDGRGVIGTAHSDDLLTWRAEPPVTRARRLRRMRGAAIFRRRRPATTCSSAPPPRRTSAARRARLAEREEAAETGTHYFIAERAAGPWRLAPTPFLAGDRLGSLYAGRAAVDPDGRARFPRISRRSSPSDGFVGAISDPIPVVVGIDGRLTLDPGAETQADAFRL